MMRVNRMSRFNSIIKALYFIRKHSLVEIWQRMIRKKNYITSNKKKYYPNAIELNQQKNKVFDYSPLISIIVPLYQTDQLFLNELIESVIAQSYCNWQLCFADGSDKGYDLYELIKRYDTINEKVKYIKLDRNYGIAENTNRAVQLADGEYFIFMDHDDLITPNALYECVLRINKVHDVQFIYSDEDKVSANGKLKYEPHFKPDFNLDLLRSVNYICHLVMVHRNLYERAGGFNSTYNGAQDYDFIFKCIENTDKIEHISKILYHWRTHSESTADNPDSKLYAFEAGRKAIEAHFSRMKYEVEVLLGDKYGLYNVKSLYCGNEPIHIIVMSHSEKDTKECIMYLESNLLYKNYVIDVVECKKKLDIPSANSLVHDSQIEIIWFVDDRIRMNRKINPSEMIGSVLRDDMGAMGFKIQYKNGNIAHAGIVIGIMKSIGYVFKNLPEYMNGYFARELCSQDLSAVSGLCMLTKRDVFLKVGGFSSEYGKYFYDIDYCLKIRELEKLILYHAGIRFVCTNQIKKDKIYGSTDEKIFVKKWGSFIKSGDPYYNPNLDYNNTDYSPK